MHSLKDIRSFDDFMDFVLKNKEVLKKAALPVLVVAALLFFWISGGQDEDIGISTDMESIESTDSLELEYENSNNAEIYVDISGCVNTPGVYSVTEGTRLFQLIEKAGGLTENADTNNINRAEEVYDGQKIIIYSVDDDASNSYISDGQTSDGKININKAASEDLQKIPGVGPATAQKIIEYRESNGRFSAIEDIKNVSGIGDKTFENMKEYITV